MKKLIALLFFGSRAVPHLGSECPCGYGNDAGSSMWDLAWWPHALLHGINPFVTDGLFAPDRVNLGGFTLLPLPALVAAPVTLLFGPLVWAMPPSVNDTPAAYAARAESLRRHRRPLGQGEFLPLLRT